MSSNRRLISQIKMTPEITGHKTEQIIFGKTVIVTPLTKLSFLSFPCPYPPLLPPPHPLPSVISCQLPNVVVLVAEEVPAVILQADTVLYKEESMKGKTPGKQ